MSNIVFVPDGNIFKSEQQTLICPVNTVGVMGNGLALAMANRFKGLLFNYRKACMKRELDIGKCWMYPINKQKQVLCFASKKDWRDPSELEYIRRALKDIAKNWRSMGIKSLAIPMVGCGEGGLKWEQVCPLIVEHIGSLPIVTEVFGEFVSPDQNV